MGSAGYGREDDLGVVDDGRIDGKEDGDETEFYL